MRRSWRAAVGVIGATALLATASACASGGPHPVTADEADRMAEMLFDLWDAGGMTFDLNAQPTPGTSERIEGRIDFTTGTGYGLVTATGEDANVDAIVFSDTVILESIPTLSDTATSVGAGDFTWISRPLDTSAYQLDGLAGVALGLGTQQRDNPELIQQSGARWLRTDTLRGVEVDVFEYSAQARFWVARGTSDLMRFEGNSSDLARPIVVDILDKGPVEVPEVDPSSVVASTDIPDLYEAYRRASAG